MQPANMSLDPMAALWSDSGSPNNTNYFQTTTPASPDQTRSNSNGANTGRSQQDSNIGMAYGLYSDSQSNQSNQGQANGQNGSTAIGGEDFRGAGDTFMGANTPGLGTAGWKWTVMDGAK